MRISIYYFTQSVFVGASLLMLASIFAAPAIAQDMAITIPSSDFDDEIYAEMDLEDPTASTKCKEEWRQYLRRSEKMTEAKANLTNRGDYASDGGDHDPGCRKNAIGSLAQKYYVADVPQKAEHLHRAELRAWDAQLEAVDPRDLWYVYQIEVNRESAVAGILFSRAKQNEGFDPRVRGFSKMSVKTVIPDVEDIIVPYQRRRIQAELAIDKLELSNASKHDPDECIESCDSVYDALSWGIVKSNAESQYKRHSRWLEELGPVTEEEPISCTDLADKSQKMSEELFWLYEKWDGMEADYLSFYNASQVKLEASFDKTHYELPSVVPFSGSLNSQFKVQTNKALRHMPSVKMSITSDAMSEFNAFMTLSNDLKDIAGKFGLQSAWLDSALKVTGDWTGFWTAGATEVELPYDEGVAAYRKNMQERQVTLDNYRRYLNLYFCKAIVPTERDIFETRTKTISESKCSPSEVDAMEGWLTRHTSFRNEIQLGRVENYCRAYETSGQP